MLCCAAMDKPDDAEKHMMQSPEQIETAVLWGMAFEKTGCIRCGSRSNTHAGWGFCLPCAKQIADQFRAT